MKLEYRDLSRPEPKRLKRKQRLFGFMDYFAASLLVFVVSWYFITPRIMERPVELLAYDPVNNSYASLGCVHDRLTKYQFTGSKDLTELRGSVRVIRHAELDRLAKPQPDAGCYAARGFVERVSRWEYFFGWLGRLMS